MTALAIESDAQQLRILGLHRSRLRPGEIGVDLFAGGGGYSEGYQWAVGMPPAVAVNHDANAIAMHTLNHPEAEHHLEDVFHVDPHTACRGRRVGILHGSPDCTHFSRAKGDVPKSKKIRGLAWAIVRWAAEVSPRIVSLENVEEFITWGPLCTDGRPIKSRAGETFRAFVAALSSGLEAGHPAYEDMHFALVGDPEDVDYPRMPLDRYEAIVAKCVAGLGYEIEWRSLRACDFGAPTTRKRLYVVGRRDGDPIRWPAPTYGPKAARPYHTAAECINWNDLGASIFLTSAEGRALGVRRPLAEATERRIAEGIRRFVLNNPKPFLVPYHSAKRPDETPRVHDVDEPVPTQTTENRFAVVSPTLMSNNTNNAPHSVEEPLGTITTGNRHFTVAPLLTPAHSHGWDENGGPSWPVDQPFGTIVAKDGKALVAPQLLNLTHGSPAESIDKPIRTITGANRGEKALVSPQLLNLSHGGVFEPIDEPARTLTATPKGGDRALIAPTLIQTSYGEREGQSPRVLDLHEPLGTVVAGGTKHGLVETFLTREAEAAAFMGRNNTGMVGRDFREVAPTICARETLSLGVAHLTKFNTGSVGSAMDEPMPTITGGGGASRPAGAAHGLGVVNALGLQVEPCPDGDGRWHVGSGYDLCVDALGLENLQQKHAAEEGDAATAHIITHNGESIGAPVDGPLPTITAGGMGHQGVVAAHVTKFYTGRAGSAADEPLHTITAEGAGHQGVVATHITKFNGTSTHGAPVDDPLHTVTGGGGKGGGHLGVAAVHLAKYYGSDEHGQGVNEPLHTVPTVDRFALVAAFLRKYDVITDDVPYVTVKINGETFILYDIAMRMLQPRELARAQGFPESYRLVGNKSQQVARIGNSVCPHVAAAIVRANLDSEEVWN